MRANMNGYRQYIIRRLLKLEKERIKKKKYRYLYYTSETRKEVARNSKYTTSHIPENFSIAQNSDVTIKYFNALIRHIMNSPTGKGLYFNFQKVSHMTIDALMYLLSIIKFLRGRVWEFSGNIPPAGSARDLFLQSGFLNSIKSHNIAVEPTESIYMKIGTEPCPSETAAICTFVHNHSENERSHTGFLYDALMELEANTADHAYSNSKDSMFRNNWMAAVEDCEQCLRFTFLDIGYGICETVHKRVNEKISLLKNDSELLESAFNGQILRTETCLYYRGKGLPKLKKYADEGLMKHFSVIANKAMCYTDESDLMLHSRGLSNEFQGTLYFWEIPKRIEERRVL